MIISEGAVSQGFTNFYKEGDGIVDNPDMDNSVTLFVNLLPLALPDQNSGSKK